MQINFNSYDTPWSWGRVSGFMKEIRLINYYTLNQHIPGEIVQFLVYFWTWIVVTFLCTLSFVNRWKLNKGLWRKLFRIVFTGYNWDSGISIIFDGIITSLLNSSSWKWACIRVMQQDHLSTEVHRKWCQRYWIGLWYMPLAAESNWA